MYSMCVCVCLLKYIYAHTLMRVFSTTCTHACAFMHPCGCLISRPGISARGTDGRERPRRAMNFRWKESISNGSKNVMKYENSFSTYAELLQIIVCQQNWQSCFSRNKEARPDGRLTSAACNSPGGHCTTGPESPDARRCRCCKYDTAGARATLQAIPGIILRFHSDP